MTATRSHKYRTTAKSCETKSMGEMPALADALQQPQDLRLHRDIERGERLVGDEYGRLQGNGARQRHPLLLAAAELSGIAAAEPTRQPDFLEHLAHMVIDLAGIHHAAGLDRQTHDVTYATSRVERPGRVLEHHLD